MKKALTILIILIAASVICLGLRFIIGGSEDAWICENGQWVKHGAPSAPMPSEPCDGEPVACAMDAKFCSDGSYVSRIPPECDFALCPPEALCEGGACPGTRTVKFYYYNPELDKDESGNVMCSRNGLIAVEREVAVSKTPIQDAIKLLLKGQIAEQERAKGISTEYPLDGFSLKGASLKDGVLTLEFADPNNKSVGGSCRVGVLWFQIEATAKQFPEVEQIRFLPEDIFQP